MRTLDHWKSRFATSPMTVDCPELRLVTGGGHEAPVFVGPGQLDIRNSTEIDFKLFAPVRDLSVLARVLHAHTSPYEFPNQFRLHAIDYEGTEWACGTTLPRIEVMSSNGTLLTGHVTTLYTSVTGKWVSQESGVELLFQPGMLLPMESSLMTVHSIGDEEIQRSWQAGRHTLNILGSTIEFFRDPKSDHLWVTANASEDLPHLCLENWLSEPFRILFGQLIAPRLVARNLGNGSAHVSLRPSPQMFTRASTSIGSLLASELSPPSARFWEIYAALFTLIAKARNEHGQPDFQPHRVTRFYEEIIQASQGSRWVWFLTLASAAEGLAKMLMTPEDRESDFSAAEIDGIKKAIRAWSGSEELKSRVLNSVAFARDRSVGNFLHSLVERQKLRPQYESAWKDVRNKVMHGNLVEPWSSEKGDEQIIALAELVHSLTFELAGVSS